MEKLTLEHDVSEKWIDIPCYEGSYQASSLGKVRSLKRIVKRKDGTNLTVNQRILIPSINRKGYSYVGLLKNGISHKNTIHKLVSMCFLGIRPYDMQVNHINGIKTDNRAINLEYVNVNDNIHHALDTGLKKCEKIDVYNTDGNFIATFDRIGLASKYTSCNQSNIYACCNGRLKSSKGYRFKYNNIDKRLSIDANTLETNPYE